MPATFIPGFDVPVEENPLQFHSNYSQQGSRAGGAQLSALDLDFESTLQTLEYSGNSHFGFYSSGGNEQFNGNGNLLAQQGNILPSNGEFDSAYGSSLPIATHSAHYQAHQPILPHYLQSSASFRDNSLSPNLDSFQSNSPTHYNSFSSHSQQDRRPNTTSSTLKLNLDSDSPSPARDSRSGAVGKAPNNTIRSRSARRASTSGPAPYATGSTPTNPAILIGSSKSIGVPTLPLAMSMPAFPTGSSSSLNNTNWLGNRPNFTATALDLSSSFGTNPYLNRVIASPPPPVEVIPVPVVVKVKKVKVKKEEWEDEDGLEEIEEDDEAEYAPTAKTKGSKKLDSMPEEKLEEKKRKRRESHNLVERRRRDNINDRICELAALIPTDFLTEEEIAMKISNINLNNSKNSNKSINKGIILTKSVDFINNLLKRLKEAEEINSSLEKIIIQLRQDQDENMQH